MLFGIGLAGCVEATPLVSSAPPGETAEPPPPPLVFVILADDLAANVVWAMPTVTERLAPECVRFSRAYVTVPLCCPVRASLLAGGEYPRNTGVQSNEQPNGGFRGFVDDRSLATRLQASGVRTALVGKYLNGYELEDGGYIPPGWDLFAGVGEIGTAYDSGIIEGSSTPEAAGVGEIGSTDGAYVVDWLVERAITFMQAEPESPTVIFLTVPSPHKGTAPAEEDRDTWADYLPRPPAYKEEDLGDKPAWLQELGAQGAVEDWDFDTDARTMLESLGAIDRGVGRVLDAIEAAGLAERSTVLFTSDNGMLQGEHWLVGKGVPYEESVRVPFYVRTPGAEGREDNRLVAMNLDLPATVAELAGLEPSGEGASLLGALTSADAPPARDHVFLETASGDHPVWAGVVTERWKYVQWGDGSRELYDLDADPWEMESVHDSGVRDADLATLAGWVQEHRSLAITTQTLAEAAVGRPYTTRLAAWGGTYPLAWSIEAGRMPDGLSLSSGGELAGVPTVAGTELVMLRVTDSVPSPLTGVPAHFSFNFDLSVVQGQAVAGAPPRWERLPGDRSRLLVHARAGARVRLLVYSDDTRDDAGTASPEARADHRGRAVLPIPPLPLGGSGALFVEVDGLEVPAGRVEG